MSVPLDVREETISSVTTPLFAVVNVRESRDSAWKETADVVSASSTGAGFYINRECQAGRLVSLTVALDQSLRCYDHQKELYKIWGLVQHCHVLTQADCEGYHVGVAFIGKNAPESYSDDPTQSYRICGMNEDGLWKISEAAKEFKPRKDARFYESIDHYLAIVDAKNNSLGGERASTQNISKSGAAVLTKLDLHVGDRVKFISEEYDFSGLAVVCNRKSSPDGRTRLNLKFVECSFPVELIVAKSAAPVEELAFVE